MTSVPFLYTNITENKNTNSNIIISIFKGLFVLLNSLEGLTNYILLLNCFKMKRKATKQITKSGSNVRSLFSLLENFNGKDFRYREHPDSSSLGNFGSMTEEDIIKITDQVKDLVEHDSTLVKRRFWYASVPFDDFDDYDDKIGTFDDGVEGTVSPLFVAISKGLEGVVGYLLSQGANALDCFCMDCCQVRAAHEAISCGNLRILQLLLESNPDALGKCYDLNLNNMASVAASEKNYEILDFLTSKGIGPVDKDGILRFMYCPVNEDDKNSFHYFKMPETYKSLDDPRLPKELKVAIDNNIKIISEKSINKEE